MAAENLKSADITNLDADPRVAVNVRNNGSRLRRFFATDEAAGGDAGSTYRMIRVRATDIIHRLEFASDDLGTGVTLDVGLYDVADSAVEDADFFASNIDVATAAVARTDITYESAEVGSNEIANGGKMLFEALGLADTPENRAKEFDIYCTSVSSTATGTICLWAEVARES